MEGVDFGAKLCRKDAFEKTKRGKSALEKSEMLARGARVSKRS
jgi:hypothetical protein